MSRRPAIPWNDFPEGGVVRQGNLWVVRLGVVVNRPKQTTKFEDSRVLLRQHYGESNSVLGYTLKAKKEFPQILQQDTFVSLFSEVENHSKPTYLYKDTKVHLLRFNSTRSPSYWFLVRHRPS